MRLASTPNKLRHSERTEESLFDLRLLPPNQILPPLDYLQFLV